MAAEWHEQWGWKEGNVDGSKPILLTAGRAMHNSPAKCRLVGLLLSSKTDPNFSLPCFLLPALLFSNVTSGQMLGFTCGLWRNWSNSSFSWVWVIMCSCQGERGFPLNKQERLEGTKMLNRSLCHWESHWEVSAMRSNTAHRQPTAGPTWSLQVSNLDTDQSHGLWYIVPIFIQFLLNNPLKLQPRVPEAVSVISK